MALNQFVEREVGTVVQDLVRKLQDAADAELRQVRRELESDLDTIRRQADTLREELETESARAAALEADLDSVIEAHRTVDGERLKAEADLAATTRACAAAEEELGIERERLETARSECARLQEAFDAEVAIKALLEADLVSSRGALTQAESRVGSLEVSVHTLETSVATFEASIASLEAELTETREAAEAGLRHAQEDAEARLREAREAAEQALRQAQEAAESSLRQLRADADAQVREARETAEAQIQASRAAADANAEGARATAEAQIRAMRTAAETEIRDVRAAADKEMRQALEAAAAQAARVADVTTRLDSSREELADARSALAAAENALRDRANELRQRDEAITRLEADLARSQAAEDTVRAEADEAREKAAGLRAEAEADAARRAEAMARAEAAETAARLAQNELAALHDQADTGVTMLQASIRALESLAASTSVAALMSELSRQLAPHFSRVAIFRVKGQHLEGEQGAGLDPATDLTKLSIPLGVDSALTRAASTRAIQDLDLLALAQEPTPLGGTPGAALAVPILFQNESFAVAYVDRVDAIEPAQHAFAALLAGQTSVLLGRLSQELKQMKELRDYAALLVQEAEQMFVADLENSRPEEDRRRRLGETIECARQLFAQRAALDGPEAARALDDYLLEVMATPTESLFAADLAIVLDDRRALRTKTG